MSQRKYVKAHQEVLIESISGKPSSEADDIWYVTTTLETDVSITCTLWTQQVKELIAQLEANGWKKESSGEKETP